MNLLQVIGGLLFIAGTTLNVLKKPEESVKVLANAETKPKKVKAKKKKAVVKPELEIVEAIEPEIVEENEPEIETENKET